MPIVVAECPVCGKRFKADERQAGRKAKCSQCGAAFVIGANAPAAPEGKPAEGGLDAMFGPSQSAQSARGSPREINAARPRVVDSPAVIARPQPTKTDESPQLEMPEIGVESLPDSDNAAPVATAPSAPPGEAASKPGPRRFDGRRKIVALIALLALIGGAGVVVVPKLMSARSGTNRPNAQGTSGGGSDQVSRAVGAAWSAQPDVAQRPPKLDDDFRLAIPAQPPLRHDPGSFLMAAASGPIVAVTLLPEAGAAQVPTIEVWNLARRLRLSQFKLDGSLLNPVISPDGAYYAGHAYDPASGANRVEIWSIPNGTRVHRIDLPPAPAIAGEVALGFPLPDQIAVYADRLTVWDLNSRRPVREVALPLRSADSHAAVSPRVKLAAVADSRTLTLVDLENARVLGRVAIPAAALAHPRQPLSLRVLAFSPDGSELALLFDNRQSTRRIAIYDVATGALRALHVPAAPVQGGGPEFQWTPDSQGFLVGSGVLLDRAAGRQMGQIYTDLPEEGLGGALVGLLDGDRALAAWDKYPKSVALRAIPVRRERAEWFNVEIASASAARYEQLQCVGREFGNALATQSLLQDGRLTDGSKFLVVRAEFTASLTADAPQTAPLRQDQFVLIADGLPKLPIGILTGDGNLSLEKPAYELRKRVPATTMLATAALRKREVVFAVSGSEKTLALRIASAQRTLQPPAQTSVQPPPALAPAMVDSLPRALFAAPDNAARVSARINWVRTKPFDDAPEAAEHVPLQVAYSSPSSRQNMVAVNFDVTVTSPQTLSRRAAVELARLGLLLPDGTHLRPVVELPGLLPFAMSVGEHHTQTALFLVPGAMPPPRMRLTYEGVPVAAVVTETAPVTSPH
jgi:hypothetical protein